MSILALSRVSSTLKEPFSILKLIKIRSLLSVGGIKIIIRALIANFKVNLHKLNATHSLIIHLFYFTIKNYIKI
jgi:hypothetical protein